jgi:hypothetical protein
VWAGLEGFALVMSLFALVVIGAVVAGGYFVALQHYRAAAAGPQASAALYAAEAGLSAALAAWPPLRVDSLSPGASAPLVSGRLPTGDEYAVRLSRLDGGEYQRLAYYLLVSTGRAHGPRGGRRQVALLLRRWNASGLCCGAALSAGGAVRVAGGAAVRGLDEVPPAWETVPGACQNVEPDSRAGILSEGSGRVTIESGAVVEGAPPVVVGAGPGSGRPAEFDLWLREAAERADFDYAGDPALDGTGPVAGVGGECDRSAPGNWGAPNRPGHPCFAYFPIVRVRGDLRLETPASGQGILMVEGDLEVSGAFEFYGIVLVGGRLRLAGPGARIFGGTIVRNAAGDTVTVAGGAQVAYSRCAAERAVTGSKLQVPHPLAQFSWFEILE